MDLTISRNPFTLLDLLSRDVLHLAPEHGLGLRACRGGIDSAVSEHIRQQRGPPPEAAGPRERLRSRSRTARYHANVCSGASKLQFDSRLPQRRE